MPLFDWWTLSYLEVSDVRKVLRGVLQALTPDGFFIVCLPVSEGPLAALFRRSKVSVATSNVLTGAPRG